MPSRTERSPERRHQASAEPAEPESSGHADTGPSSVVARVHALLNLIALNAEPVGVREAARRTNIDRSAVSRLFSQLAEFGLVAQVAETGRFAPGSGLYALAASLHARDTLSNAARPILQELVARFGETCYVAAREGDHVVFRERIDSPHPIRYVIDVGRPYHLSARTAGLAILAAMPDDDADQLLVEGLERSGNADSDMLARDRELIAGHRDLGYLASAGMRIPGGAGIAAPFVDASGALAGSLAMSLPSERLDRSRVPEIGAELVRAAAELSRRLGFHPHGPRT